MSMTRSLFRAPHRPYLSLSIAVAGGTAFALSRMSSTAPTPSAFTATPLPPRHKTWPYTAADFVRQDPSSDAIFYKPARLVTHIDDPAIRALEAYYTTALPREGHILDFCSSWTSHLPTPVVEAIQAGALKVTGTGMNAAELNANPLLSTRVVKDLNVDPQVPRDRYDAATCVVSIDYLIQPVEVLRSLRECMVPGGVVHLVISNRCFPTKVVARWLRISEEERLRMVGDYLHFAGWTKVEIIDLKASADAQEQGGLSGFMRRMGMGEDPLWVVRGSKE